MSDEKSPAPAVQTGGKSKKKTLILIAAVMGLEGVGVFFVAKMLNAPPASAEAGTDHSADPAADHVDAAHADPHAPADSHAATSPAGEHGGDAAGGKPGKVGTLTLSETEIELPECRPSNKMTGKLVLFRMRVSVLVATPQAEKAKALLEANKSRIHDRINFVVRSADPLHLNEPGLETIKRRIKHELDRIVGDDQLFQEILVPELLQSGYGV